MIPARLLSSSVLTYKTFHIETAKNEECRDVYEMGGACGTREKKQRCLQRFGGEPE